MHLTKHERNEIPAFHDKGYGVHDVEPVHSDQARKTTISNGLGRNKASDEYMQTVETKLNSRYMAVLGYQASTEAYHVLQRTIPLRNRKVDG